ncbi:hypothetical protein SteCoe_4335 [Stentor coeruleus]|uniref:Myb-like DNA-binding domain containing protein n=1 Tax=Stentor coeruleus TaxID=5963 RepID=A0A1R2CUU3_9CILI|nr:hypothetical protein SteCoe_4335 [Stentor coeruleus]
MASISRKPKLWTVEQDDLLKQLVENHGSQTWPMICQEFLETSGVKRTPKQCRDRWVNNLRSEKNDAPWKEEEVMILFDNQSKYGNQWSIIAKEMKGRTENQIKNLFYSTIRRNIRKFNKGKLDLERIKFKSLSILENQEIRNILTTRKSISKNFFLKTFLTKEAVNVIQSQFSQQQSTVCTENKTNYLALPEMNFTTDDFYISDDSGSSNPTFESEDLLYDNDYTTLEFSDLLNNPIY